MLGRAALVAVALLGVLATGSRAFALAGGYFGNGSWPGMSQSLADPRDAVQAMDGEIFVADAGGRRIIVLASDGTFLRAFDGSDSPDAELVSPAGIALGPDGRVYVADEGDDKIVVFERAGTYVRSWGSRGSAPGQMWAPSDVALDPSGTVFVSDRNNGRVQAFTATGSFVRSFGTQGSGTTQLSAPVSLSIAGTEVFVGDQGNGRVQVFSTTGAHLRSWGIIAGNGTAATHSRYGLITGITALSGGSVYVVDDGTSLDEERAYVEQCDSFGNVVTRFAGPGALLTPRQVAVLSDGTVLVPDVPGGSAAPMIRRFSPPDPLVSWTWSGSTAAGLFASPAGVAAAPDGGFYVADTANNRVQRFNASGAYVSTFATAGAAALSAPVGVAVSADGSEVYVTSSGAGLVKVYSGAGAYLRTLCAPGAGAGQLANPSSIDVGADGSLYIANTGNHRIERVTAAGAYVSSYGDASTLSAPEGVSVTTTGTVWVADTGNSRVRSFSASGAPGPVIGQYGDVPGSFIKPAAVSVDPSGDLVVADTVNDRVQRVTTGGAFTAMIASGGAGSGEVHGPRGVDVAADGSVYIADTQNHRVARVGYDATPPSTTASGTFSTWVSKPVTVTLNAVDAGSGVRETWYRVDAGTDTRYGTPFSISSNGKSTIRYWSLDRVGNRETTGVVQVWVDSMPPTGTVSLAGGASVIGTTTTTLVSNVTDAATMRVDTGSGWGPRGSYVSSRAITLPGEGLRTVRTQFFDTLDNTLTVDSQVTVDLTAPTSSIAGVPELGVTNSTVLVSVASTDSVAGVAATYVSIDEAPEELYLGGTIAVSGEGMHTVSVRSVDAVGNAEEPVGAVFEIDMTAPFGAMALSGGASVVGDPLVSLEPGVSGAVQMRLDFGAGYGDWAPYQPLVEGSLPSTEGTHVIRGQFRDPVGNMLALELPVTLDLSAPVTTAHGIPAGVTGADVVVTLEATDTYGAVATTMISVDGAVATEYLSPVTVSAEGTHTVSFYSVDTLGHQEATTTVGFEIQSGVPTGTFSLNGGSPYARDPVVSVEASVTDAATMAFDTGSGYGPWVSFAPTSTFVLEGEGLHTVVAAFRSARGKVSTMTAQITVDTTSPRVSPVGVALTGIASVGGSDRFSVVASSTASDANGVTGWSWRVGRAVRSAQQVAQLSSLTAGTQPLSVWVSDPAGNRGQARALLALGAGPAPWAAAPTRAGGFTTVQASLPATPVAGVRYGVVALQQQPDGAWAARSRAVPAYARGAGGWAARARMTLPSGQWRFVLVTTARQRVIMSPASPPIATP